MLSLTGCEAGEQHGQHLGEQLRLCVLTVLDWKDRLCFLCFLCFFLCVFSRVFLWFFSSFFKGILGVSWCCFSGDLLCLALQKVFLGIIIFIFLRLLKQS